MTIHAIRTDVDLQAAIKRIEFLMDAEYGSPEGEELEILSTLASAYEKEHFPMPPSEPIAAIEFALDQQRMTRRDLEPLLGTRGRVSEVLSGKRPLTLAMIRKLSSTLKIPADILIQVSTRSARHVTSKGKTRTATPSKPEQAQAQRRKTTRRQAATQARSHSRAA